MIDGGKPVKRANESEHRTTAMARPEVSVLYERALPAKRTGPLYGAFPYPTKISPDAIALYIASHTKPGDTVFDGFAGSGTTGVAALELGRRFILVDNNPEALAVMAHRFDGIEGIVWVGFDPASVLEHSKD